MPASFRCKGGTSVRGSEPGKPHRRSCFVKRNRHDEARGRERCVRDRNMIRKRDGYKSGNSANRPYAAFAGRRTRVPRRMLRERMRRVNSGPIASACATTMVAQPLWSWAALGGISMKPIRITRMAIRGMTSRAYAPCRYGAGPRPSRTTSLADSRKIDGRGWKGPCASDPILPVNIRKTEILCVVPYP